MPATTYQGEIRKYDMEMDDGDLVPQIDFFLSIFQNEMKIGELFFEGHIFPLTLKVDEIDGFYKNPRFPEIKWSLSEIIIDDQREGRPGGLGKRTFPKTEEFKFMMKTWIVEAKNFNNANTSKLRILGT